MQLSAAIVAVLLVLSLPDLVDAGGRVHVRGYTRRNGTVVAPHWRGAPDGIASNNLSYSPRSAGPSTSAPISRGLQVGPGGEELAPGETYVPRSPTAAGEDPAQLHRAAPVLALARARPHASGLPGGSRSPAREGRSRPGRESATPVRRGTASEGSDRASIVRPAGLEGAPRGIDVRSADSAYRGLVIDWAGVTTGAVALYGAALATYSFLVGRREKERVLRVSMSSGFLEFGPNLSDVMLLIAVANPGHRDVTIQTPFIRLPNGSSLILMNPGSDASFPHDLREGRSCTVWREIRQVASQLKEHGFTGRIKLRPACRDGVGNEHVGKPWPLNVDEWTRHSSVR